MGQPASVRFEKPRSGCPADASDSIATASPISLSVTSSSVPRATRCITSPTTSSSGKRSTRRAGWLREVILSQSHPGDCECVARVRLARCPQAPSLPSRKPRGNLDHRPSVIYRVEGKCSTESARAFNREDVGARKLERPVEQGCVAGPRVREFRGRPISSTAQAASVSLPLSTPITMAILLG
jgi:hypothetical protein